MSWLPQFLAAALASVLAITLHEVAHGWAALALGDDTAKNARRLSLNPLRHVDPVGTLLLPGALVLMQLLTIGRVEFMFGWAKPVPVNGYRLWRTPGGQVRVGMALVAIAGPAMNLALAILAALLFHPLGALESSLSPDSVEWGYRFLAMAVLANLVLGIFNLLPLPPLDGGRIMVGILPLPLAARFAQLERFGMLIVLLGVFVLPRVAPGVDPVGWLLRHVVGAVLLGILRLTGNA